MRSGVPCNNASTEPSSRLRTQDAARDADDDGFEIVIVGQFLHDA
jgi:hypothetical protein